MVLTIEFGGVVEKAVCFVGLFVSVVVVNFDWEEYRSRCRLYTSSRVAIGVARA